MVSPRIAIEKRQPFGPAKSWMWSGGPLQTRPYDLDGRQTSYPYTGVGTVNLTYDLGNRIKNLSGKVTKAYGYDGPRPPGKLDRLTTYSNETYAYDGPRPPRAMARAPPCNGASPPVSKRLVACADSKKQITGATAIP